MLPLKNLARKGLKHLKLLTPGHVADMADEIDEVTPEVEKRPETT